MKAQFLTSLDVRFISDKEAVLLSPLRFYSKMLDKVFEAPAGFITDFTSVWRVPVIFDLLGDRAHYASGLHDYLYWSGIVDQKTADLLMFEACIASGIDEPSSWAYYNGLALLGGIKYRKLRREQKEKTGRYSIKDLT